MCYKSPGPRCSAWAKKRLDEAKRKSTTWGDQESYDKRKEALRQAKLDCDATPAGQKYLKMRIAQGADYKGVYVERLKNGIALRKKQLDAIKAVDEGDKFNHEFEAPFHTTAPHPDSIDTRRVGWVFGKSAPELIEYDRASDNAIKMMTPDEQSALYWLTSDGGPYLNRKLAKKDTTSGKWTWEAAAGQYSREYKPTFVKDKVRALNSAFRKHRLSEPANLYRGVNDWSLPDELVNGDMTQTKALASEYLHERYPVGKEVKIQEYMSTSADPAGALRFTGYRAPIVLEIQTKSAIPVGQMSAWTNSEREYMVNKNGKYRVEGIYSNVEYARKSNNSGDFDESDYVTVVRLIEVD